MLWDCKVNTIICANSSKARVVTQMISGRVRRQPFHPKTHSHVAGIDCASAPQAQPNLFPLRILSPRPDKNISRDTKEPRMLDEPTSSAT